MRYSLTGIRPTPEIFSPAPRTERGPEPRLGIGLITFNRLATLRQTVQRLEAFTEAAHCVVVADDGSTDGTREWLAHEGLDHVTGENAGPGINKNRALFFLLNCTDCDPILLIEEDCQPSDFGWEQDWIEAARLWHHVNYRLPHWGDWFMEKPHVQGHAGSPADPYWWDGFTGQCTVTTRFALERVGFLDARLKGFGEEHVEWTKRFGRLLHWPLDPNTGNVEVPTINGPRQRMIDVGTYYNEEETHRNMAIHAQIAGEGIYRPPFRTEVEQDALAGEIGRALMRRWSLKG